MSLVPTRRRASIAATGLVVVIITFVSIMFGELVPKRMGQIVPRGRGAPRGPAHDVGCPSWPCPSSQLLTSSTAGACCASGCARYQATRGVTEEEIARATGGGHRTPA